MGWAKSSECQHLSAEGLWHRLSGRCHKSPIIRGNPQFKLNSIISTELRSMAALRRPNCCLLVPTEDFSLVGNGQ